MRYAQINNEMNCQPGNYLMSFGYHYCHQFEKELRSFSVESQQKLTQIKLCLIQGLNLDRSLTCENVRSRSLNRHIECYLQHGFCQMPMSDRLKVYQVVLKELFEPDVFEVAQAIRRQCGLVLFNVNKAEFDFTGLLE
ncbi:MAG: hypothetical protein IT288_05340 [Bdellovibrionales bacterium]|nr:hypothetical protein [Bdellovibrionales bacterium]